jgi:hypothetical protein
MNQIQNDLKKKKNLTRCKTKKELKLIVGVNDVVEKEIVHYLSVLQ